VTSVRPELAPVRVLDLRSRQTNPPALVRGKRKHRVDRVGRVIERDPSDVVGVCLHQTACIFGPAHDPERRLERALGVAGHAVAFRTGEVVLANPLRWVVLAANGLNDVSLNLEIEGLYPGLVDDPATAPNEARKTTWGGRPDIVTELVVRAAHRALRELVELGRAEGMPIRYLWAHRQSSPTRRSDPGAELWQRVGLEFGVDVLGLETQPELTLKSKKGRGRPIPIEWDPRGHGRY
jgi:hypothetical protein